MSSPSVSQASGYPVDSNGFVRQCAWCRRVADADGQYLTVATALIHDASHGCCEACEIRFFDLRRFRPV
jgi:predicted HD phosphohydrolase